MDLQNNALFLLVLLTWNAIAAFSEEHGHSQTCLLSVATLLSS